MTKKDNTLGTISLVSGIVGLIILPIVFSTLAIILGAIGSRDKQKYAKEGFLLGTVGLILSILIMKFVSSKMDSFLFALL